MNAGTPGLGDRQMSQIDKVNLFVQDVQGLAINLSARSQVHGSASPLHQFIEIRITVESPVIRDPRVIQPVENFSRVVVQ